jgi:xanthine dehydrogenase YagT iron-sulfur-binding subunit
MDDALDRWLSEAPPSARVRRPLVVAFASAWDPAAPELRRIRAALRALQSALLVATKESAWLLGADDPDECVPAWGPAPDAGISLYVIDEAGATRWSRDDSSSEPAPELLAHALERAVCELADLARSEVNEAVKVRLTRRECVIASLAGGLAIALEGCGRSGERVAPTSNATTALLEPPQPPEATITLRINGDDRRITLDARTTLLDALRERLDLPGTKKGCDHGQCGACTVLVGKRRVLACLTLAVSAHEKEITTIEGLARGEALHPMQQAFLDEDAYQCGFCTPGQIMSAVGLLEEGVPDDEGGIREKMSGNICRCGAYSNIVAAIGRVKSGGG